MSRRLSEAALLALVLNLFLMRPAALGQNLTPVALGASIALASLHLVLRRSAALPLPLKRDLAWTVVAFILYWLYVVPVSVLHGSNLDNVYKELVAATIVVACYAAVLADARANYRFFNYLSVVVSVLGWSSFLTLAIGAVVGFDALWLTSFAIKGYEGSEAGASTGSIYLPLSMLSAKMTVDDVGIMRFSGFFREAGIYQAVACLCLAREALTRRTRWVMGGLVVGTLAAFSTIGLVVLVLTVGGILVGRSQISPKRLLVAVLLFALAAPVALYAPYIGLEAKKETHGASVSDRMEAVANAWESVVDNPEGTGLYSGAQQNATVTLLALTREIGVVGLMLQAFILSGWRPGSGRRAFLKILLCFPVFSTALLSQPIAGAPMMYVLVMVCAATEVCGANLEARRLPPRTRVVARVEVKASRASNHRMSERRW